MLPYHCRNKFVVVQVNFQLEKIEDQLKYVFENLEIKKVPLSIFPHFAFREANPVPKTGARRLRDS